MSQDYLFLIDADLVSAMYGTLAYLQFIGKS